MKTEWESSIPVRFLGPENVTAYNAKGEVIEEPICPECKQYMSQLIGKTHFSWVCCACGHSTEAKEF